MRAKTAATWLDEDIYAAVKSGSATIYLGYLDSVYAGFMVLTTETSNDDGSVSLLVWVAYTTTLEATRRGLEDVKQMALKAGFSSVVIRSPREAWFYRLSPLGYKVTDIKFELKLKD